MAKSIVVSDFMNSKNLKFVWDAPLHKTEVQIMIPEFHENKFEITGDWGPMYHISVNPENPLQVGYKDLKSGIEDNYTLEQRSFKMESPMVYKVRKDFPFMIQIKDEGKGFDFHLYMNTSADLGKIEVFRSSDSVKLFDSTID